ncbi:MAG: hypothetical protein ACYDDU_01540 [Dermatophilaceae bacterium]
MNENRMDTRPDESDGGLAKGEDPGLGATIDGLLMTIAERTGTQV